MVWLRNPKTLFDFLGGNYGSYAILGLVARRSLLWYLRKKILPKPKLITVLKYSSLARPALVFFLESWIYLLLKEWQDSHPSYFDLK